MLTANTVLPFFYLASLLCLVLGVVLIVTVKSTQELKVSVSPAGRRMFFLVKLAGEQGLAKRLIALEGNKIKRGSGLSER